ncbi:ornithine decarboxylase, partial [Trichonephila clavata]
LTQEIKTSLEKNFPTEDIEIIAEPGCYCVASAFSLVTSIIGKKSIAQNGNNGIQKEYYLNDGFYGSFPYFYKDYAVKHVPLLTPAEVEIKHLYETNRYVFIQNSRLRLECIPNLPEVSDYIADVADLIESAEDMSDFSLDL